ncbi:MAG: helix-turn-helix transcriptional regulator [Flavobacteriaceae bacterium]|nr:helix-turn-helix transcriptional regulator [Flavobacteriaceae bacterium]
MDQIVRIKTIHDVHRILGLEKPQHPLVSVIKIDDRITNFDYGDAKYVFDFYQINLKLGFSGSMLYGRNSYDFDDGSLTFIKPNQTIQVENREEIEGSSGWTLLFHPDLIRKSMLGDSIDTYSFFDYDLSEALHLSVKERNALTDLVIKIEDEYRQNIDKHSQELIVSNIELLLKYSKRFYDRQFYTRSNLNKDVVARFHKMLKGYYMNDRAQSNGVLTVRDCAQELHLSVNYFGDLIKAETGKSAKDHIHDFVIEKAKTKLLGSNEAISEIAYSFGFEYPQGFTKLFKTKVGMSPKQFRNSL